MQFHPIVPEQVWTVAISAWCLKMSYFVCDGIVMAGYQEVNSQDTIRRFLAMSLPYMLSLQPVPAGATRVTAERL